MSFQAQWRHQDMPGILSNSTHARRAESSAGMWLDCYKCQMAFSQIQTVHTLWWKPAYGGHAGPLLFGSSLRSTVKAWYKGAGPNLIRKCWLWHHIKITTLEDYEKERISNSKSYKGVELNTKWYVLTIKCIFIARKIRHGKFLANIWSQCTCQYDVIMKIFDAPQLQREADHAVFNDKNCIL